MAVMPWCSLSRIRGGRLSSLGRRRLRPPSVSMVCRGVLIYSRVGIFAARRSVCPKVRADAAWDVIGMLVSVPLSPETTYWIDPVLDWPRSSEDLPLFGPRGWRRFRRPLAPLRRRSRSGRPDSRGPVRRFRIRLTRPLSSVACGLCLPRRKFGFSTASRDCSSKSPMVLTLSVKFSH